MPLKNSSFGDAQLRLYCRALQQIMASLVHVDPICQRMKSHTVSALPISFRNSSSRIQVCPESSSLAVHSTWCNEQFSCKPSYFIYSDCFMEVFLSQRTVLFGCELFYLNGRDSGAAVVQGTYTTQGNLWGRR